LFAYSVAGFSASSCQLFSREWAQKKPRIDQAMLRLYMKIEKYLL
jgi:hypothetical protein